MFVRSLPEIDFYPHFCFQNPPWQIILYNESGVAYASRGVVIDILNELSRKLNFTYTMHLSTQAILSTANLTEDGNSTVCIGFIL